MAHVFNERYEERGREFRMKIDELASKDWELDPLAIGWLLAAGHSVDRNRRMRSVEAPTPKQMDTQDAGDGILGVWDLCCHAAGTAWMAGEDPWTAAFRAGDAFLWEAASWQEDLVEVCLAYHKPSNPAPRAPRGLFLGYVGYARSFLEAALPEGEGRKILSSFTAHPALLEAGRKACERYNRFQAELASL